MESDENNFILNSEQNTIYACDINILFVTRRSGQKMYVQYWASIHKAVRRLTAKSLEVSRPRDWVLWW